MKILSFPNFLGIFLLALSSASFAELVINDSSGFGSCVIDFDQLGSGAISGSLEIGTSENANTNKSIFLDSSSGGLIATYMQSAAFGNNGVWNFFDDSGSFAASSSGDNPTDRFLNFSFNTGPVSSVGGFINYCTGPFTGCANTDVTITAIASDGSILESYNLLVDAPVAPEGEFRGIVRPSNDIAAFRISSSGTFFALDDLAFNEINQTPVPSANELFPLNAMTTWTYLVDSSVIETETVLPDTRIVNGIGTIGIQGSDGNIEYYSNDGVGLRDHLAVDINGDTITLIPPATLLNSQPSICDVINNTGNAQFNIIGTGVLNFPYTYTSRFVGQESISVPLGTFDAFRVETSITISGTSNGFFIDSNITSTSWLVEDIGVVKVISNDDGIIETRELVSVSNPPEITSPLTGTVLTSDSVNVTWDAMNTNPQNWAVRAGTTGPGSYDLAVPPFSGAGASSQMLTGLPTDGSSFTISLFAFQNGAWSVVDSEVVTAFTGPQPGQPEITSPLTGTVLTSDSVNVTWDAMNTNPQNWAVRAGTTGPGSYDLAVPPFSGAGASSQMLTGLPTDGSSFTISLFAFQNGAWSVVDSEVVTAFTGPQPGQPEITSPLTGTVLTSDSVNVTWDAMNTNPQNWAVRAGTTGPGSYDLAVPPFSGAGASSQMLTGLPTDGSSFTISLFAFQNGAWSVVDSEVVTAFTGPQPGQPEITSPLTGTVLTSDSVNVTWDAMNTNPQNWAVRAGTTGPGSYDLAVPPFSGAGASSQMLTGLPTDGSSFTISLFAFQNGAWSVVDSEVVTAFTGPQPGQPEITSPLTGTVLTSDSVNVTWDAMNTNPQNWAVRAGTTGPGSYDLAVPPFSGAGASSQMLTGLPTDGSSFTISLFAFQNGAWSVVDSEVVTAFTGPQPGQPEITSPLTGTVLTSDSVNVTWDAMNTNPQNWAVRAGTTGPGSYDLAVPPFSGAGASSQMLTGLPTDGSSFTISLFAFQNGAWSVVDSEVVTAFTGPQPGQPEITSPLTGTVLTSDSVNVTWDAMNTNPQNWAVRAGTTGPGSYDLAVPPFSGAGASSQMLTGLPTDGSSFTISLFAFQNGAWSVVDSEVVTAFTGPQPGQPEITSPLTGTVLTSDSVNVTWDAMNTNPQNWAVRAGTTGPGSYDLAVPPFSGAGASSQMLTGLPTDGSSFTISLFAFQNGAWSVVDSEVVTAFTGPQPGQPEITSPLTGTVLTSDSVNVTWDAMNTNPQNWAVRAGTTGPGSYDLAVPPFSGAGASSQMLTGLPTDGSSFTISLFAFQNGAWSVVDSEVVTAFTGPQPGQPEITSPLTGTVLTSDSVNVTWDAMNTNPQNWAVRAGTTGPGSYDLAVPPFSGAGASSQMLTGLPTDGSSFTISLFAFQNGAWSVVDSEVVTAFTGPQPGQPEITSPLTGTVLTSDSVNVTWDAMNTNPQNWAVRAGTTGPGSYDLAVPPFSGAGASSQMLTGLPTDGSSFTISLFAFQNGAWSVVDSEVVTAATSFVGTYNISGTQTDSNCQDPANNTTGTFTGVLNIPSQSGNTFVGTLTWLTADGISLAGTGLSVTGIYTANSIQSTNASGNYNLDLSQGATLLSQSIGAFNSSLSGKTISINYSGMESTGDLCQNTGSFSGSR